MNDYYWTLDSFGSGPLPENAEEIVSRANAMIDKFCDLEPYCGTDEIEIFSDALWEDFCRTGSLPEWPDRMDEEMICE